MSLGTTALSNAAPAAAPAPLRRLPVPCCEPPYDDELIGDPTTAWGRSRILSTTDPEAGVQGTLALSFVLPSGVPAVPQQPPELRLVCRGPDAEPEAGKEADTVDFGPQPTRREVLPEPRSWAGRVVQAIVEVLAGVRPVSQLVRWTTAEVYDEISSRVAPLRSHVEQLAPRGVVRSVHVTEPADGVAEVCALVRRGARSTAVALRLEGMDGRWQCTALELG
jgi:hypothetical protein